MANRQQVQYTEAWDQQKDTVPQKNYFTHLINIILVNLNERDSINYYNQIMQNAPDAYKYGSTVKQLRGINDSSKQLELENARNSINNSATLSAANSNVIIKYTEELLNTITNTSKQITLIDCGYYKNSVITPVKSVTIAQTDINFFFDPDEATENGKMHRYFTVPKGVRVFKVTKIGSPSTQIVLNRVDFDENANAYVTKKVWFDTSKDTTNYIYVDVDRSYEFDLVSSTGKDVPNCGVSVTYSSEINYNIPTMYDSEVVTEAVENGTFSYTLDSNGSLNTTISVPNNILAYQIGFNGNKLMITSGTGDDTNIWFSYKCSTTDTKNPAITYIAGGSYDLTFVSDSSNAGKTVTFTYSTQINFTKADFYGINADFASTMIRLCNATNLKCANMKRIYDYKDTATGQTVIYECTSTKRRVETTVPAGTQTSIPRVKANEIVYADNWTAISTYLRAISQSLDSLYKGKFNNSGGCAVTCMTKCQAQCQLACQGCNGWTCHDQNCGGLS